MQARRKKHKSRQRESRALHQAIRDALTMRAQGEFSLPPYFPTNPSPQSPPRPSDDSRAIDAMLKSLDERRTSPISKSPIWKRVGAKLQQLSREPSNAQRRNSFLVSRSTAPLSKQNGIL